MAQLEKIVNRFKGFNFENLLLKVIRDNDNIIIDLNTDNQLFTFGIDSEGNKLQPYRSSEYAALKAMLNPNRVTDLKLEGDFYKGFFVDASRFPVTVDSRDGKTEELVFKYGEEIFGLTDENIREFVEQVLDEIQLTQKKALGIS